MEELQEGLTQEKRLQILEVAQRTFVGQEPFEDYLGKLTQYVVDGIYKQIYVIQKQTDDGEIDEREA